MINDTTNIDAFISSSRIHGIHFDVLRATFNSNSKANLDQLGNLLKEDNLSFVIKRSFLWKWELIIETPITEKYTEEEYQKIVGKFFILASRFFVNLVTIGLIG